MKTNLNKEFKTALEEGYMYGDIVMNKKGEIYIEFSKGHNGRGETKEIQLTV